MKMIHKSKLKGKYISYYQKENKNDPGSLRTHKVIKIDGNTLTVKDANGVKRRINPSTTSILGRQHRKSGIEEIDWSIAKPPPKRKQKQKKASVEKMRTHDDTIESEKTIFKPVEQIKLYQ